MIRSRLFLWRFSSNDQIKASSRVPEPRCRPGGLLMFANVIVPLDGSQEATAVLPTARIIAAAVGACMSLVRAVRRPAGSFASHADEMREAATYLDGVVHKKLHLAGLAIST